MCKVLYTILITLARLPPPRRLPTIENREVPMKIVDEKGKLFGKINLIDLLVVIVLIAAILFLAVRFTRGSDADPVGASTKLNYTVLVSGISPDVYAEVQRQLANAGGTDQLMANGELVSGYVTGVTAAPHINFQPDANGMVTPSVEEGDNARLDLTFTVEATVPDPTVNLVGTQEVRVGKSHILKTTHFEFTYGSILTCNWG